LLEERTTDGLKRSSNGDQDRRRTEI